MLASETFILEIAPAFGLLLLITGSFAAKLFAVNPLGMCVPVLNRIEAGFDNIVGYTLLAQFIADPNLAETPRYSRTDKHFRKPFVT